MSGKTQLRPILSSLRRHKTSVFLLVVEMALTMAVLGNVIFVVYGSFQRAHTPTGVVEDQLGVIQSIGVVGSHNPGNTAANVDLLRQVPGVDAASFGGPPLWNVENDPIYLDPSRQTSVVHAYEFAGSQGLTETLGLKVSQGRDFRLLDVPDPASLSNDSVMPVVVTQALADRLWPHGDALGQQFYDGGPVAFHVIGIVPHLRGEITGRVSDDYSIVVEFLATAKQDNGGAFMIRSQPAQLDSTLRRAAEALQKANPGHVTNRYFTMAAQRDDYFKGAESVNRMLLTIMAILIIVTTLGVGGLASFWVQQRRRQIGIRRALGASRGAILYYFHIENFLIVAAGVLLGAVFTLLLNRFLMLRFELPPLPALYFAMGAAALWLIGQVAVFGPARRAAAVPPNEALR